MDTYDMIYKVANIGGLGITLPITYLGESLSSFIIHSFIVYFLKMRCLLFIGFIFLISYSELKFVLPNLVWFIIYIFFNNSAEFQLIFKNFNMHFIVKHHVHLWY